MFSDSLHRTQMGGRLGDLLVTFLPDLSDCIESTNKKCNRLLTSVQDRMEFVAYTMDRRLVGI